MTNNHPRLDDMGIFVAVVRAGSFTEAAEHLGLAKSTVSARISQLEQHLNIRLLQRTTRSLRTTDDGALYFEHCAQVVDAAVAADRALRRSSKQPTGTLRITSPRLFAEAFLVPVLTPYLQAYPEVSVELDLTERNADLVGEGFDLALRIGVPADSSMVIRRLGAAPMLFVASHGYVESHGVPTKAESFGNHQLIVVSSGGDVRWPIRQGGDVRPVPVRGRLKVNSLVVARRAALSGLGVAFLPRFMVRDDLESGELVEVLAGLGPEPMPVCALYPSREQLSPRVRVFLDLLVAHTRDHSPWS